ncbi:hypothetical protein C5748_17800 [Phyllobacterium phragmitis]|uniref:Uncharacterized protein n=1 Tax=Phyllobacterium phragmitis TaxID=2670329 RepID=A0A2S9IP86_9HYPH|nr:hypothetical protein [Phyllobacterium phragmitis]PRD42302.1 hypothetical protein C5748_17800 [Phyllobacterium phragmitis]
MGSLRPQPVRNQIGKVCYGIFSADLQVSGTLLLIDAKDERAAASYKSYGALEIPKTPLSLVLPYSVFLTAMEQAGKPIL